MLRVVSLLPSATETLCLVGGSGLLVGRSHECDFPADMQDRPVLTGQITRFDSSAAVDRRVSAALGEGRSLYTLDEQRLRHLRPDVILTQDLCSVCSIDVESVRRIAADLAPPPRIISLNPHSIEDVFDDALTIGRAVGLERAAAHAVVALRERFHCASDFVAPYAGGPSVAHLEWTDPLFVAGHWTPQLIERAGAAHPLNPTPRGDGAAGAPPSRRVTPEELIAARLDAVIICPCGLDLGRAKNEAAALASQPWWRDLPAARAGRIAVVDGNQMFSRPGPRLVDAFEWLVSWLHDRPALTPRDFPWTLLTPR